MKTLVTVVLCLSTFASAEWKPALKTSWNYQIGSSTVNFSVHVQAYDIDGFDSTSTQVAAIHSTGAKAICYIDVGTWENWRPDAKSFPSSVLGASNGWPGERWLDIRQLNILSPIMTKRFQMCRKKGFDAIEGDNVDGYTNRTGFPLTATQQLTYNRFYAGIAHSLGLPIALKNDVDQVPQLVGYFDFAIDEQCFEYGECSTLKPFINANKAVFEVEYSGSPSTFCPKAHALNFNSIKKTESLIALPLTQCR